MSSMLSENGSPIAVETSRVRVRSSRGRNTIITVPLENGKVHYANVVDSWDCDLYLMMMLILVAGG
jgi:hypothetical protein